MTDTIDFTRHLPVPGTHNFRDAGGYATENGGSIRWRTLFRSDSLHRIERPAQREIVSLGVRTVVDLRQADEAARLPNVFAASNEVRYMHLPLAPFPNGPKRMAETLEELNLIWLDHCQEQIAGILSGLGTPDAFPSVVHCAVGKDRTGLIVALLLRLAGVPRETVVEDYALSELYADVVIAEHRSRLIESGVDPAKLTVMLECRAGVMEVTMDHLDAEYGGVLDYVGRIGVPDATVEALRAALVDESVKSYAP